MEAQSWAREGSSALISPVKVTEESIPAVGVHLRCKSERSVTGEGGSPSAPGPRRRTAVVGSASDGNSRCATGTPGAGHDTEPELEASGVRAADPRQRTAHGRLAAATCISAGEKRGSPVNPRPYQALA